MVALTRKQKEDLIIALYERGKTYMEIAHEAGVSPNTIKETLNKAGLIQTSSKASKALELYSQQKTPLEVAITLDIDADKAISLHGEYFKLLGCTEFTRVYQWIRDDPWPFVNLVKLIQNAGMDEDQVNNLLNISKNHLPRVTAEYEKLKTEVNSLEYQNSNLAKGYQRLCKEIAELNKTVDQLQLTKKELNDENSKLEFQKIRLQNLVKNFQDNGLEYNIVKRKIKAMIEYILADRRRLLTIAAQSVTELLRVDPQKFHSFYYNRSSMLPENGEEPLLIDAEQVYEKILENTTNELVTGLSDNISSASTFLQEGSYKEAVHPNFDAIESDSNNTTN
jgi:predicted transcriptional regulator